MIAMSAASVGVAVALGHCVLQTLHFVMFEQDPPAALQFGTGIAALFSKPSSSQQAHFSVTDVSSGEGYAATAAWTDLVGWLAPSSLAFSEWEWRQLGLAVVVTTAAIAVLGFAWVVRARRGAPREIAPLASELDQVYRRYSRSEVTKNPAIVSASRRISATAASEASASVGSSLMAESGIASTGPALQVLGEAGGWRPITGQKIRVGRHSDNEIVVPDPSVHRHHIEIEQDQVGRWSIIDLGGVNGSFVNGKSCKRQYLEDGDLIELGETRLRFVTLGKGRC